MAHNNSKIAEYITRARSMGSTATTVRGAGKYILAHTASPLAQKKLVTPRMSRAAVRNARIIQRYAGMTRFPRYLGAEDRAVVLASREHKNIVQLRTLPECARAWFIEDATRAVARVARELAAMDAAKGELVESGIIADDARLYRWSGAGDKRMIANRGDSVAPSQVCVWESGSNSNWSKRSTFDRRIDYCYIVPQIRVGAWVSYYFDPQGIGRRVFRTKHFLRIEGCSAVRIPDAHTTTTAWPVHIQRRILASAVPSVLTVEYDRTAKHLLLRDATGEDYHVPTIRTLAHADIQVRAAVAAFRKRRAEKVIAFNPTKAYVSLEDSYAAGNCVPMSEQFAHEMWSRIGAAGPCAVRADVILAYRDDSYTRRACMMAACRQQI